MQKGYEMLGNKGGHLGSIYDQLYAQWLITAVVYARGLQAYG